MDPETKRPGSVTAWLAALVVLVLLAGTGGFVAFLPLSRCPQTVHDETESTSPAGIRCYRCGDRGRITLLSRWRDGSASLPEWEGKVVSAVVSVGFEKTDADEAIGRAGISPGQPVTKRLKTRALKILRETGAYTRVEINVYANRDSAGQVVVDVVVDERED